MRNERYDFIHLPEEFQRQHKTCEFLLYQIEDFVVKDAFKGLRQQRVKFDEELEFEDGKHILDYLLENNRTHDHDQIITSHILLALIADSVQFLQIALFSSLQERLTVTFSLIRKPFVYNLIIILRLYLTTDFLERFNNENGFDTTAVSQDEIIALLNASESLILSKAIKATDLFDFIFNPTLEDSLVNMCNKALHPSTTRNKNNKTEIQNINFVFSSKKSHLTQWDYLYRRLPLLMLYLVELLEAFMADHLKPDDSVYAERFKERAEFFKENKVV